jgi:hypothetical protein
MDLTDEDWNSEEATTAALVIAGSAPFAAIAVAGAIAAIAALVIAVIVAAIAALIVAALALNSKRMRFPGAVLHYWRRIKHD